MSNGNTHSTWMGPNRFVAESVQVCVILGKLLEIFSPLAGFDENKKGCTFGRRLDDITM
jgi:hypothetical protein